MKNQTNTTTEYRHTNLNSNKYYKRFLLKAVSMIAIPIMTVSMLPNFALADDMNTANTTNENVNYSNLIDTQNLSQTAQDTDSTHTISVNLSTIEMENPYQSVKLNDDSTIPEPINDVTVYNIKAESVQYDNDSNPETENNSQITTETKPETKTEPQPTSTYRYANLVSITNDERYLAYCIIAGEVGPCSYKDKLYVAQCLYNAKVRCKLTAGDHKGHSLFDIRSEYGYAGYTDFNAFKQECINSGVTYYEDIIKAVNEVFDNFNMPSDEFVLYFYNPKKCKSGFHESQKFIEQTSAHKYFALVDNKLPQL
jgi:spore germination cell wall hydrolase CwlJ-like protein